MHTKTQAPIDIHSLCVAHLSAPHHHSTKSSSDRQRNGGGGKREKVKNSRLLLDLFLFLGVYFMYIMDIIFRFYFHIENDSSTVYLPRAAFESVLTLVLLSFIINNCSFE